MNANGIGKIMIKIYNNKNNKLDIINKNNSHNNIILILINSIQISNNKIQVIVFPIVRIVLNKLKIMNFKKLNHK